MAKPKRRTLNKGFLHGGIEPGKHANIGLNERIGSGKPTIKPNRYLRGLIRKVKKGRPLD